MVTYCFLFLNTYLQLGHGLEQLPFGLHSTLTLKISKKVASHRHQSIFWPRLKII